MKKLFLGGMMLAGLLMNTACSSSDEPQASGETVTVNLTAAINNAATARTTDNAVNVLHYAIYTSRKAANGVTEELTATKVSGNTTAKNEWGNFTLTVDLVKNQSYRIVFWAQNENCQAYTLGNQLETVTVDYSKEITDAYFGKSDIINVTQPISESVTLSRPMAQLNINASDVLEAAQLGYKITKAEVTVSEYANVIYLLTGSTTIAENTDGEPLVWSASAEWADGYTPNNENNTDNLISKLILPTGNNVTVNAKINGGVAADGGIAIEVPNVPLKANYRTNIDGNWLTVGGNGFTVTLDNYGDDTTTIDPNNPTTSGSGNANE